MIVKNEEDMIGKCLESVKDVVDEIVIVDTGSTDKTKEIVKQYTDRIFDFKWIDDFSAARNESFSKATKDYILWLDADDILLPEDAKKLKQLKETLNENVDCVHFFYNYAFNAEGKPSLVFRRERLVKRNRNFKWIGFIHEYISTNGIMENADIYVTHTRVHGEADRNLNIYRKKLKEGVPFSSRDQYYYGKELYYHGLADEAIEVLKQFTKMQVWVEDLLDAMYRIADCYEWKKEYKTARKYLFECLEYEKPRAECLYRIGKMFQLEEQFEKAVYWYTLAITAEKPKDCSGFLFDEFWTWKPHLELCVCYYKLGDIEKSIYHNEEAAKYLPNSEAVKFNRNFFKSLEKNK